MIIYNQEKSGKYDSYRCQQMMNKCITSMKFVQ